MADRRCFTKKITESDAFLDMPLSTQCLYFHLNMNACDDDGFVSNPKRVMRLIGASEDDLKLLLIKNFVIGFESGVIVIKHWRMHNTLRQDRYTHTAFVEELEQLQVKSNGSYTLGNQLATIWQPTDNQLATQDKISKDKLREDKNNIGKTNRFLQPIFEEVVSYINEKQLNVDAENWYSYYESNGWMVGRNHMKDWKACLRQWNSRNKPKEKTFTSDEMNVETSNVADIRNAMFKKG